jgi:hypothetical protein
MSLKSVATTVVVCEADDRPLTGMAIEITGFQVNLFSEDIGACAAVLPAAGFRRVLPHAPGRQAEHIEVR